MELVEEILGGMEAPSDPAPTPGVPAPAPPLLSTVLRGVDLEGWKEVLDLNLLRDALRRVGETSPPPELILEALRYGTAKDVTAVLLGQDPYTANAQGLCFSSLEGKLPGSLQRIFGCVKALGLCLDGPPHSGDLRPWAVQGVLMLNTALTTAVGERRSHAAIWKQFTNTLLERLCATAKHKLYFMLWGGDARAYAGLVRRHGHIALEWTHPSPLSDNQLSEELRFARCPHFKVINDGLAASGRPAIAWDNVASIDAFSDGSCTDNGGPNARAAFAAVIKGGQFGGASVLRGEVQPRPYYLCEEGGVTSVTTEAPATASVPAKSSKAKSVNPTIPPSNNRGEMLGIIYCMLALLRGRALGHVLIVSDSKICVQTLLEWLPARRKKGTAHELQNFDLIQIAEQLLERLRAQCVAVRFEHVRSHQRAPGPTATARERGLHAGNEQADAHAGAPLKRPRTSREAASHTVEVLDAPAVLRALGDTGARA